MASCFAVAPAVFAVHSPGCSDVKKEYHQFVNGLAEDNLLSVPTYASQAPHLLTSHSLRLLRSALGLIFMHGDGICRLNPDIDTSCAAKVQNCSKVYLGLNTVRGTPDACHATTLCPKTKTRPTWDGTHYIDQRMAGVLDHDRREKTAPSSPLCAWSTSTRQNSGRNIWWKLGNKTHTVHKASRCRYTPTRPTDQLPMRSGAKKRPKSSGCPHSLRSRMTFWHRFLFFPHLLKSFSNGEANSSKRGTPPPPPLLAGPPSSCATAASQRSTTPSDPYHSSGLSTEWKTPSSVTCSAPSRCANTSGTQASPGRQSSK